jgi:hypothetical protein
VKAQLLAGTYTLQANRNSLPDEMTHLGNIERRTHMARIEHAIVNQFDKEQTERKLHSDKYGLSRRNI